MQSPPKPTATHGLAFFSIPNQTLRATAQSAEKTNFLDLCSYTSYRIARSPSCSSLLSHRLLPIEDASAIRIRSPNYATAALGLCRRIQLVTIAALPHRFDLDRLFSNRTPRAIILSSRNFLHRLDQVLVWSCTAAESRLVKLDSSLVWLDLCRHRPAAGTDHHHLCQNTNHHILQAIYRTPGFSCGRLLS